MVSELKDYLLMRVDRYISAPGGVKEWILRVGTSVSPPILCESYRARVVFHLSDQIGMFN